MPERRSIFKTDSTVLKVVATGTGLFVGFLVAPHLASAYAAGVTASYFGTGLLATGAGIHASVQAYNLAMAASPFVAAASAGTTIAAVNGAARAVGAFRGAMARRRLDRALGADVEPVHARNLVHHLDLAVDGYNLGQDNQPIRRTLSL